LCGYYFREIFREQYDDFLEQMIDQYDDLNTKIKEIFDLYMKDYKSHQGLDFYYFYNDEFNECNKTLMENNINELKNVFETIMTRNMFTVRQKNQIQLLVFSLISGVFISYFYYKCKLQVLQQVPDVSINFENVKQLSVINEFKIQTNKIKQSYVDLFISRYLFERSSTSTSSSSSFIASSLLK
jgi:predicted membrane GTPase involved in stress response